MLCGRLREASAAAGGQAAPDSSTASVYAIWRSPAGSGASGQEKLHVLLDLRRDTSPTCLHAAVGLADAAEGVEELYGVSLRPKAEDGASPGDSLWALLCTATASPHGVVPVFLNEKGTQPAAVAVRHFLAAYQKDVLIRCAEHTAQRLLSSVCSGPDCVRWTECPRMLSRRACSRWMMPPGCSCTEVCGMHDVRGQLSNRNRRSACPRTHTLTWWLPPCRHRPPPAGCPRAAGDSISGGGSSWRARMRWRRRWRCWCRPPAGCTQAQARGGHGRRWGAGRGEGGERSTTPSSVRPHVCGQPQCPTAIETRHPPSLRPV